MSLLSNFRSRRKGQTILETAFVFSAMIFLTFAVMNLGIVFHTKMIATYAAFMAGRSFQVLGNQSGHNFFQESFEEDGSSPQEFLAEMKDSKNPAFFRVAEDIFTCSLPWLNVPKEDELDPVQIKNPDEGPTTEERCRSGKRKYEKLNIGQISFKAWNEDQASAVESGESSGLIPVVGGFSEGRRFGPDGEEEVTALARSPLSYGILELPFRSPIPFAAFINFGTSKPVFQSRVNVPVLLNPGLEIKLVKSDDEGKDSFKDSSEVSAPGGGDGN